MFELSLTVRFPRHLFDHFVRACGELELDVKPDEEDCGLSVFNDDYELASIVKSRGDWLIVFNSIDGPTACATDLATKLREFNELGEDPLGDHHGRNA